MIEKRTKKKKMRFSEKMEDPSCNTMKNEKSVCWHSIYRKGIQEP
jgi:hypothetical protein